MHGGLRSQNLNEVPLLDDDPFGEDACRRTSAGISRAERPVSYSCRVPFRRSALTD